MTDLSILSMFIVDLLIFDRLIFDILTFDLLILDIFIFDLWWVGESILINDDVDCDVKNYVFSGLKSMLLLFLVLFYL